MINTARGGRMKTDAVVVFVESAVDAAVIVTGSPAGSDAGAV